MLNAKCWILNEMHKNDFIEIIANNLVFTIHHSLLYQEVHRVP